MLMKEGVNQMNATMYMIPVGKLELSKESESVRETLEKMKEGSFKTLPVVDNSNHFIGVIHESSLYEAYFYNEVDIEEFMNAEIRPLVKKDIESIHKNADFLQVILSMEKMDIHFLPCVDDQQRFLGIVTRNNIFQAFESAFGYNQDGYLIEIVTIDAKGQLARLAKTISLTNSNIVSTIQFDLVVANLERVIVKVQTDNIDNLLEKISDEGFRVTNYNFVPKVEK
jgi:acetoin utilization protein AcuB